MPRTDMKMDALLDDFEALVRLHPPAAIHDDVAYQNAMRLINQLTSLPRPTEGQLKYLDTLTILIERYEDETEGVQPEGVDALSVLRFLMEDRGMNASDLGRLLGDRTLSKAHIKILARHFNVSPAVLLD